MSGTSESVQVETEPPGASVLVRPGDVRVVTPATLKLSRSDAPYTLKIDLEGYRPQRTYIRGRGNPWLWGNILLGGVPGILIDWATGSVVDLEPDEIRLVLEPKPEDGTP